MVFKQRRDIQIFIKDIHTHNCKEYISSTAANWPDATAADAKIK